MFWSHRPGGTVLPAMTKIQFLQATGSLFRIIKLCPGIEGSSLRRGALRGLPAPSRLRRPLEKLLGMEAAFCETKVQSVPHVIPRKNESETMEKCFKKRPESLIQNWGQKCEAPELVRPRLSVLVSLCSEYCHTYIYIYIYSVQLHVELIFGSEELSVIVLNTIPV